MLITYIQLKLEPKIDEDKLSITLMRNPETKVWSSIDGSGNVKLGLHPSEIDLAMRIQKLIQEWNSQNDKPK